MIFSIFYFIFFVKGVFIMELVKCEFCGNISADNYFISYKNYIKLGICYDCHYNPTIISDLRRNNDFFLRLSLDEQFKLLWYYKYGIHFTD